MSLSSNRLRVGIIMGGKSIEREVSFNSGRTIYDHINTLLYEPIVIFQRKNGDLFLLPIHFIYRGKITDFEHRLDSEAQKIIWDQLPSLIDFMYIATHGQFAEDGRLQGFLEILDIPYLGAGVGASAFRMNKIKHKQLLLASGILVPNFFSIYPFEITHDNLLKEVVFSIPQVIPGPWIVKPAHEGSSLGVFVVEKETMLFESIKKASCVNGVWQSVVVEQKIQGMEFSCIILIDNKTGEKMPLMPSEIILEPDKKFYDYEQKYMPGRALLYTPARIIHDLITKIQATCIRVMELLEFETIARIDGFLKEDGSVVIFDPNSLSGMAPSSFLFRQAACHGMKHADLINHLIQSELLWGKKKRKLDHETKN
jgi:D-alanine-D-alanine ligase